MLSVLTTKKYCQQQRDWRKHLKVVDVFSTLIVVLILWMFAYVQTHKIEYIEYEQFSVSQSYFNKNVKK